MFIEATHSMLWVASQVERRLPGSRPAKGPGCWVRPVREMNEFAMHAFRRSMEVCEHREVVGVGPDDL
jgi:hypothetical protein